MRSRSALVPQASPNVATDEKSSVGMSLIKVTQPNSKVTLDTVLEMFGIRMILANWIKAAHIGRSTVMARIQRAIDLETALTTPDSSGNQLTQDRANQFWKSNQPTPISPDGIWMVVQEYGPETFIPRIENRNGVQDLGWFETYTDAWQSYAAASGAANIQSPTDDQTSVEVKGSSSAPARSQNETQLQPVKSQT